MSLPDDWWRPRSCTCSVWATVQLVRFGGERKFIQNRKYRWLFRTLWRPPGDDEQWYSYVPLRVPKHRSRILTNLHITVHSVWFRGEPKAVKAA